MSKKYKRKTDEHYVELEKETDDPRTTLKRLREINKELIRIYGYGYRIPVEFLYPDLPMQVSIASAIASGLLLLLTVLRLLLK